MSFSDWKKRSKLLPKVDHIIPWHLSGIEQLCEAAYKAGERDGRKHIYEVLENAAQVSGQLLKEKRHRDWLDAA